MPTWLAHGFRWRREQIRIHVILQNLDDAAPEWLMAPATRACMTQNFKEQWPQEMAQLPDLCFLEQYDPEDITSKSQPYAYVCDIAHEVKLGVDVEDLRGNGLAEEQWAAIAELRDKVAPGEKLGWFVIVNGDVERWAPLVEDEEDGDTTPDASQWSPTSQQSSVGQAEHTRAGSVDPAASKSLKKWIGGRLKRAKSSKDLTSETLNKPWPSLPPLSPGAALQLRFKNQNKQLPLPPTPPVPVVKERSR